MAGLSPDEERALLVSQLSTPSIPTASADEIRARIINGAPPNEGNLLGRLAGSAARAERAATALTPIGLGRMAADAGAKALGYSPVNIAKPPVIDEKKPIDFAPSGESKPVPMDTPAANVGPAPTLDPRYTQVGRSLGGAGGMGGGSSLKLQLDQARANQFRTLEEQKDLAGDVAMSRAGAIEARSILEEQEAERQRQAAESAYRVEQDTQARNAAYLKRTEEMAEEIGKMSVDPGRLMKSQDAKTMFAWTIGSALGGALAAVNGGPNDFLQRIDKAIDRDIDAQKTAIENKRTALSERRSVFGQMLQMTGDARLAEREHRTALYEAAKLSLKARADSLGIPEIRAQAALGINELQQRIDAMKMQNAADAWKAFQAAAAAAEAQRRAAEERAFEHALKVAELGIKGQEAEAKLLAAGKEGQKEDNQAITEASKRLGDKDLISSGELIRNMMRHIRPDGTVMGFDTGAKARLGAAKGLSLGLLPEAATTKIALNDEERIARQDWDQLALIFRKATTGSGGAEKELAEIKKAYEGAGSDAERRAVLGRLEAVQNKLEAQAKAPLNDKQKVELDRRLAREGVGPQMPATVKLK